MSALSGYITYRLVWKRNPAHDTGKDEGFVPDGIVAALAAGQLETGHLPEGQGQTLSLVAYVLEPHSPQEIAQSVPGATWVAPARAAAILDRANRIYPGLSLSFDDDGRITGWPDVP